jgi:hypothetical protein
MTPARKGRTMENKPDSRAYREPEVVDYGTLVDLTAAMGVGFHEDGMHKTHDPSKPHAR